MKLADPSKIFVQGEFAERLARSIDHLVELNTSEMRLEFNSPSEFWHWGADYMGRWISAISLLGHHSGEDYGVREVVAELIAFQNKDGSFGSFSDPHDFQEWFGMSRGLVGLLEHYWIYPDEQVLIAARRLGDYYTEYYPDSDPCMYECFSTALEGIVLLYRLTEAQKYLQTARRMAETCAVLMGVRYSPDVAANGRRTPVAGQVHCQLSTARGLLDLYEITGEDRYLQAVLKLRDFILQELLWVSGGIGFYYFRPEENETCADADWFRLNLQLWRLTGDVTCMHLAERILLNQLYFNQVENGGFCYLRGLQNRAGAVFDACCSHHGPRAFYEGLRHAVTTQNNSVYINLFLEMDAGVELDRGTLRISAKSNFQQNQMTYTVRILEVPGGPILTKIRFPEWIDQAGISVDGKSAEFKVEQGYAHLERAWQAGDELEITFTFQVTVLRGQKLGEHILQQNEFAVYYGPRLFCLNDIHNPTVRLHLARLRLPPNPAHAFTVVAPDRLEATGFTPGRPDERLVFTPLANVGGAPSGSGRIHTVRSPYYRVWISSDNH